MPSDNNSFTPKQGVNVAAVRAESQINTAKALIDINIGSSDKEGKKNGGKNKTFVQVKQI